MISINKILNAARKGARITALRAKYNGVEEDWAITLFTKKHVVHQPNDEVIQTGNKEFNISELGRILHGIKSRKGKWLVKFWLNDGVVEGYLAD